MTAAEQQAAYMAAHPEQREKKRQRQYSKRWKEFGGTWELFLKFWKKQKGRCGICKVKLAEYGDNSDRSKGAQFDHCHDSLRPRGLLCMRCNVKLEWAVRYRDEIEEYLS